MTDVSIVTPAFCGTAELRNPLLTTEVAEDTEENQNNPAEHDPPSSCSPPHPLKHPCGNTPATLAFPRHESTSPPAAVP